MDSAAKGSVAGEGINPQAGWGKLLFSTWLCVGYTSLDITHQLWLTSIYVCTHTHTHVQAYPFLVSNTEDMQLGRVR